MAGPRAQDGRQVAPRGGDLGRWERHHLAPLRRPAGRALLEDDGGRLRLHALRPGGLLWLI